MKRVHSSGDMTIQPSVTLSLVPEAVGGPFVLSGSLVDGVRRAAALGFGAVEIFAPEAAKVPARELKAVLAETGLSVSALATGAGVMLKGFHLAHPDVAVRQQAQRFVGDFIALAGEVGTAPVIGLMGGMVERGDTPSEAYRRMEDSVAALDQQAGQAGITLLLEPINRYETSLLNRLEQGIALIESVQLCNTRLLADTFHMNIEEVSIEAALAAAAKHLGHMHWADSNRRPPCSGHLDFAAIGGTLRSIGYCGSVAFECLPYPNPENAAAACLSISQATLSDHLDS